MNNDSEAPKDSAELTPELSRTLLLILRHYMIGKKKVAVSKQLGVSRGTLDSWLKGKLERIEAHNVDKILSLSAVVHPHGVAETAAIYGRKKCFLQENHNGSVTYVCEPCDVPPSQSVVLYNGRIGYFKQTRNGAPVFENLHDPGDVEIVDIIPNHIVLGALAPVGWPDV